MTKDDFHIGLEFYTGSGKWRCTDIGTRVSWRSSSTGTMIRAGTPGRRTRWSKMCLTSSIWAGAAWIPKIFTGMSTVVNDIPRIMDMQVTDDLITARLADGRSISVPLAWSWRLSEATPEQRSNFEIIGSGLGVHWPDIDEDISATGMLYGIPARPHKAEKRPKRSVAQPILRPAPVPA